MHKIEAQYDGSDKQVSWAIIDILLFVCHIRFPDAGSSDGFRWHLRIWLVCCTSSQIYTTLSGHPTSSSSTDCV